MASLGGMALQIKDINTIFNSSIFNSNIVEANKNTKQISSGIKNLTELFSKNFSTTQNKSFKDINNRLLGLESSTKQIQKTLTSLEKTGFNTIKKDLKKLVTRPIASKGSTLPGMLSGIPNLIQTVKSGGVTGALGNLAKSAGSSILSGGKTLLKGAGILNLVAGVGEIGAGVATGNKKSIGAGAGSLVGGGIGAALGSIVPGLGTAVGMAVGSFVGDKIGETVGSLFEDNNSAIKDKFADLEKSSEKTVKEQEKSQKKLFESSSSGIISDISNKISEIFTSIKSFFSDALNNLPGMDTLKEGWNNVKNFFTGGGGSGSSSGGSANVNDSSFTSSKQRTYADLAKFNDRGSRNVNPGNVKGRGYLGQIGIDDKNHAIFATKEAGVAGIVDRLYRYNQDYKKGDSLSGKKTIRQIMNTYAPASDNNNTPRYIASIAKHLGIDPDQQIDFKKNPELLKPFVKAIMLNESPGRKAYSDSEIDKGIEIGVDSALLGKEVSREKHAQYLKAGSSGKGISSGTQNGTSPIKLDNNSTLNDIYSQSISQQTLSAKGRVGYHNTATRSGPWTGKHLSQGMIDCSGWVGHSNYEIMQQINQQTGKEIFSKDVMNIFAGGDHGGTEKNARTQVAMLQKVTGKTYDDAFLKDRNNLREGMVVSVNSGKHVIQTYKDPKTGEIRFSHSGSSKGVEDFSIDEAYRKFGKSSWTAANVLDAANTKALKEYQNEQLAKDKGAEPVKEAPTQEEQSETPTYRRRGRCSIDFPEEDEEEENTGGEPVAPPKEAKSDYKHDLGVRGDNYGKGGVDTEYHKVALREDFSRDYLDKEAAKKKREELEEEIENDWFSDHRGHIEETRAKRKEINELKEIEEGNRFRINSDYCHQRTTGGEGPRHYTFTGQSSRLDRLKDADEDFSFYGYNTMPDKEELQQIASSKRLKLTGNVTEEEKKVAEIHNENIEVAKQMLKELEEKEAAKPLENPAQEPQQQQQQPTVIQQQTGGQTGQNAQNAEASSTNNDPFKINDPQTQAYRIDPLTPVGA